MTAIVRRTLIAGLAASCALAGIRHPASADTPDLTETLLSVVGDRRSAAALGQSWVNHRRGGIKAVDLANRLADALRAQGWSGSNDPAELRQRFNAAVRADYRKGETVTVAGWQLARAQAELCALAYFASVELH
ncbi:MAG TPA: hypothetical protein VHA35_07930 [Dongiaceae bacterium]|nr:hypothetical protein [Dongiaceae bacterium]